MNKPTKRKEFLGISDGTLCMSGDWTEHREGMMMLAEHHLLGFGDCMSTFDCMGFLHNEAEIKQKFQDLYDTFMKEFDYYAKSDPADDQRYDIVPKPDHLKYSEGAQDPLPEAFVPSREEVAA